MSLPISKLHPKKVGVGLRKLDAAGFTVDDWLALCNARPEAIARLKNAWPFTMPSFTCDAVSLLGFGTSSNHPLPKPRSGEVVIRVGAWSLNDLYAKTSRLEFYSCERGELGRKHSWEYEKLTPGVYRIRLPIPNSQGKPFEEQQKLLLPNETIPPAALIATVLMCSPLVGRTHVPGWFLNCRGEAKDFHGERFRGIEQTYEGAHMEFSVYEDHFTVRSAEESQLMNGWMLGVRKCRSSD